MIFMLNGVFLGSDFDMIGFGREGSGTPIPVGTHTVLDATSNTLNDEDVTAAYMAGRSDNSLGVFGSVSGTLTITSSSSDRVEGSFNFSATMLLGGGDAMLGVEDLNISGTFVAGPGTIPTGVGS
jgi:hypothetical protein